MVEEPHVQVRDAQPFVAVVRGGAIDRQRSRVLDGGGVEREPEHAVAMELPQAVRQRGDVGQQVPHAHQRIGMLRSIAPWTGRRRGRLADDPLAFFGIERPAQGHDIQVQMQPFLDERPPHGQVGGADPVYAPNTHRRPRRG